MNVAATRGGRGADLGVAIIGGGFMAGVHTAAARASRARLVGIVSSSPAASAQAAERLGFERGYAHLDELLADPEVHAVHVTTPNTLHASQALAALDAGKHVICEKPLATTTAEATALLRTARAAGLVGAVPFVYRFHPLVREARARCARGARIFTVTGAYLQDWLLDQADDNWRVGTELGGRSRAFADIGSHLVDLIEFITGQRMRSVTAAAEAFHARRGSRTQVDTEDAVVLIGRLHGGALVSATVSQVAPGRKNALRLEISGQEETLAFDQESPELLWIGRRKHSVLLPRDAAQTSPDSERLSVVPAGHPQGYVEAFTAFTSDAYAAMNGTAPDGLPTFADGVRAAQIVDSVLASVARGESVEIPKSPNDSWR